TLHGQEYGIQIQLRLYAGSSVRRIVLCGTAAARERLGPCWSINVVLIGSGPGSGHPFHVAIVVQHVLTFLLMIGAVHRLLIGGRRVGLQAALGAGRIIAVGRQSKVSRHVSIELVAGVGNSVIRRIRIGIGVAEVVAGGEVGSLRGRQLV